MKRIFNYSETYLLIGLILAGIFNVATEIISEGGTWTHVFLMCVALSAGIGLYCGLVWAITKRYYEDEVAEVILRYLDMLVEKDAIKVNKKRE